METAQNLVPPAAEFLPWITAALLGVGLAATSGLRTFLPLLLLAGSVKFGWFGISLGSTYAWLASDLAFVALLLATIFEVAADKIPFVDHGLDAAGTVLRPVAGALAVAAVWNGTDPAAAALIGLIVGAPLALGMHTAKAGTRAGSTAVTAGVGNPILSVLEDFVALFLGVTALLVPLLVPLLLVIALLFIWWIYRLAQRLRGTAS
jgi:hypothetical protein